ncbi:MAG: protein-methionine-sulfoxide reductase catalytic subunit MsrP [Acidobacteriaceae bacterium]|nr:protein-methionine-sulfoxide reductase catalytic subunit MsrP [Acidobacteriaceae bacterium]
MLIKILKGWEIPERQAIPEHLYYNRRDLLKAVGLLGAGSLLRAGTEAKSPYPAKRNADFTLDRPITLEAAAEGYNNFYEFNQEDKEAVKNMVGPFKTSPWEVEVTGLVNKPKKFDVDDLVRNMPLEERLYRHRCVEAWSMAVPWTGFPFSLLIKEVDPKPEAKYVRFVSVYRPKEMPGQVRYNFYPWPYFEGLRMDEAMNPLCLMVTGLFGKPLPKQNGAPIRMVLPWKYGYKSPKSIVKIEFIAKQPDIFWHRTTPSEYGFYSNVNPKKPHPRWSQATEHFLPTMERRPTLLYNGYEQYVAGMYDGKEF